MLVKYESIPNPMGGGGEERATVPGNAMGVPIFSRQYRHLAAITPQPDATPGPTDHGAPLDFPSDGIMVSANCNVTCVLADSYAEDPLATPILLPLLAGVQYDLAIARVTVVSTGTAYALYHRKPSAP